MRKRTLTDGDNWGFLARPGYDQATGPGVMDGEKLFEGLRRYDGHVAP